MNTEANSDFSRKKQIKELVAKLKPKIIFFNVIDRNGQIIGKVQDISILKDGEVNFLISLVKTLTQSNLFLLNSKYIQKIDLQHKSLIVDLDNVKSLPLYDPNPENSTQLLTNPVLNNSQDQNLKTLQKKIVPLLEEKLKVNYTKEKVGEIRVSKKIETRLVEVPVRWEKLIVEQIGSENKQLAEIYLGQGKVTGVELNKFDVTDTNSNTGSVSGEFISLKAASDLLEAIALQKESGCVKVRVELILEDQEKKATYQEMFDRCSGNK
jgi:hypothetical protein